VNSHPTARTEFVRAALGASSRPPLWVLAPTRRARVVLRPAISPMNVLRLSEATTGVFHDAGRSANSARGPHLGDSVQLTSPWRTASELICWAAAAGRLRGLVGARAATSSRPVGWLPAARRLGCGCDGPRARARLARTRADGSLHSARRCGSVRVAARVVHWRASFSGVSARAGALP